MRFTFTKEGGDCAQGELGFTSYSYMLETRANFWYAETSQKLISFTIIIEKICHC